MTDDAITLPPRFHWLHDALVPVLRKLEAALAEPRLPTMSVSAMRKAVTEGLHALDASKAHLKEAVHGLMNGVCTRQEASERDVYQAAWRVEVVLDVMIEHYLKICRYRGGGRDEEVCVLLMSLFHHSMRQTRDWLQELLDTLASPRRALLRRGLPTTGKVKISLTFALSSAPEAEQLQQWMEAKPLCLPAPAPVPAPTPVPAPMPVPAYHAYPRPPRPVQRRGVDLFDIILGSAIGWGIGNALFGDD